MRNEAKRILDIERILNAKLGEKKAKHVPKFVVRWLRKLAHEDWVNVFLWEAQGETGTVWLQHCLRYMNATITVHGEENLPSPSDGRLLTFVSNHPLGGPDGVAIGAVIGKHYGDRFRYLVNDMLMSLPGLAVLCYPVNKTGRQGRDFPRIVEQCFGGDNHVLMFPAGLCSRLIDGKIQDLPWKKTFVTKSVESHRDIVPIYFSGHNSKRFYVVAKLAQMLHLKFNPAMLLLADELYRHRGHTFDMYIGKPIPWQTLDKSKTARQWAAEIRNKVYTELKK